MLHTVTFTRSFTELTMNLRLLREAVGSVLGAKKSKYVPELTPKGTTTAAVDSSMPIEQFMPLTCDDEIFPLLDLPIELVEAILSETVIAVGVDRAVRLRLVNSESIYHMFKVTLTS